MLDRLSERDFLRQEDGGSNKPKQQRQQRERQRSKFGLAKQPFCKTPHFFACTTMMWKFLISRFCGGCKHEKTIF